jgi:hypothetical protein
MHRKKHILAALIICALLLLSLSVYAQGEVQSRIRSIGQVLAFDHDDTNAFFFKTHDGFAIRIQMHVPELRCYLANHVKQDLRLDYSVYESEDSSGEYRTNIGERLLSMKTGEELSDWLAKELADPDALERHHKKLFDFINTPGSVRH